jgi:hypothetical protein
LNRETRTTLLLDIWSLGVALLALVSDDSPGSNRSLDAIKKALRSGRLYRDAQSTGGVSCELQWLEQWIQLIEMCLCCNPHAWSGWKACWQLCAHESSRATTVRECACSTVTSSKEYVAVSYRYSTSAKVPRYEKRKMGCHPGTVNRHMHVQAGCTLLSWPPIRPADSGIVHFNRLFQLLWRLNRHDAMQASKGMSMPRW